MMDNPIITIITTVYNKEKYLEQAILSVLNQSFKKYEWIIVNDGSIDNSENIILSFDDRRIQYFKTKNQGQSKASNFALKYSKGRYIKFFDADDIMNLTHLEEQLMKMGNNSNILVSCKWGRFYEQYPDNVVFKPELVWRDLTSLEWMKIALSQKSDMMPAWLWLIPSDVITKVGGWDEMLTLNNDFEFSMRLLSSVSEVKFCEKAQMFYRSGIKSLSTMTNLKYQHSAFLSCQLGGNYLIHLEDTSLTRRLIANRYKQLLFRIYPHNIELSKQIEKKIILLGGSNIKMDGGKLFLVFRTFLGWKNAARVKYYSSSIKAVYNFLWIEKIKFHLL
jgi:glycosyltransferase involved in cell wall biosynthesis